MNLPISRVRPPEPDAAASAGSRRPESIDRFSIIRPLGAGGMGEVFLATHPVTGLQVAVKRLKPELVGAPHLTRRFLAEARHMYHLNHPRIARVMEVWDPPAGPYYVMQYFAAGSLAEAIRDGQPCDYGLTLKVATDIGSALLYAHQRGILHRDLKPANVLLDSDGHASLSDFGLLRELGTNMDLVDGAARYCEGTAPYMSPLVASGGVEDRRGDIYSFGALLYELLTGCPPYPCLSGSMVQTLQAIQRGPPPRIARLNPHAPANLIAVAEGCMARELHQRYAQMEDVVADLRLASNGGTPLGPHRSPLPRWHWRTAWLILLLIIFASGWIAKNRWFHLRGENLLAALELEKATTPQAKRLTDGALVLSSTSENPRASVVFSNTPRGDYDFLLEFTRVEGDDGLDEILSYHSRGFCFTLAGAQNTTSSFWWVGSGGFGNNPTRVFNPEWLKNGNRYRSRIEVRAGRVTAYLDDAKIAEHLGDYRDLHFPHDDELPDLWAGRLGLSILNSRFIIHRAEVIER